MIGDEAYRWLIQGSTGSGRDDFDTHVVASILALALAEARACDRNICDGLGLSPAAFATVVGEMFPMVSEELRAMAGDATPVVDAEEQSVRDILLMYASGRAALERSLAAMIARRAKAPHHLWQDLGLRQRGELSELMQRHFAGLTARNRNDMKWKKFLYRMVCGSEGFTLCTSPVCSDCDDFEDCFGDENGESRLARIGNTPAVQGGV